MVPFNDLQPLHRELSTELQRAVARTLDSGWYILGQEVEAFEAAFARYHGGGSAVGVASGTNAIELALRAAGIGPGDEVITVAHTAVATVCGVERAGARPVLVDIDPETCTMDPRAAAAAITPRTRALLPVHLYGHPADLDALVELAQAHGLLLIEDCAQAHGARYRGQLVGTFGDLASFSFYPTKNLGACGDGGAVLTRDPALAERLRRLRNYGQRTRYQHAERGINSRLDELQAAILSAKLPYLDQHNNERRRLAELYDHYLDPALVDLPRARPEVRHVYHLFVVRSPDRDALRERMRQMGVHSQVHYPTPVHLQPAYADLGYAEGSLPCTEQAAAEVLSLPLYVGLREEDVVRVAHSLRAEQRRAA